MKITKPFLLAALELADNEKSKIGDRERETYGLSSLRVKSLINNLCSKDNTKYLEIGVYKGSTILSAVANNKTCTAVGVEDFSYDEREPKKFAPEGTYWTNVESQLHSNIQRYRDPDSGVDIKNITIIKESFQKVNWSENKDFDICFFDVNPVNTKIYDDFFESVLPAMSTHSLLLFSNYSNAVHAKELEDALVRHADKITVEWKESRTSSGLSDATQYYSGIVAVGMSKKVVAQATTATAKVLEKAKATVATNPTMKAT